MATLYKRPGSPYWQAAYYDTDGKRYYRSTKKVRKPEALVAAARFEQAARLTTSKDEEQARQILGALEEASHKAVKGGLNEAVGRELLNRMMEISTGESMRTATIEEWFNGWLADKKGSKSHGTYLKYEGIVRTFLASLSGQKRAAPLGALTVAEIRKYRDGLVKGGRTPGTANGVIKILRGPLNAARRQGLIAHNPAEAVEMLAAENHEKECFSPAQVKALIDAAEGDWKGLVLGGFYTGARLGDLSQLSWESVNLERGSISFTQGKTQQAIEIPIHPEFKRWLTQRAKPKKPATGFVFPDLHGVGTRGRNGLSSEFGRLMKKAEIETKVVAAKGKNGRKRSSLSFHSLRHSFNSAMANAGVTQEIRQRLTGHASKAINDRYTHAELATLRKAVDAVPALEGGSGVS